MNDERHECPNCDSDNTALGADWLYCNDCAIVSHTYKTLEPPQSPPENRAISLPVKFNINCLMCRGKGRIERWNLWHDESYDCHICDGKGVVPITIRNDETKIAPKQIPPVFDDITNVVKLLDSDNTFTLYIPNADVQLAHIKPDKLYRVTITEVVGGDE